MVLFAYCDWISLTKRKKALKNNKNSDLNRKF